MPFWNKCQTLVPSVIHKLLIPRAAQLGTSIAHHQPVNAASQANFALPQSVDSSVALISGGLEGMPHNFRTPVAEGGGFLLQLLLMGEGDRGRRA